jgi:hypothetical protein
MLVEAPPHSPVVQAVLLGYDLNFNLVSSKASYDRTVTVEALAFEQVDTNYPKNEEAQGYQQT